MAFLHSGRACAHGVLSVGGIHLITAVIAVTKMTPARWVLLDSMNAPSPLLALHGECGSLLSSVMSLRSYVKAVLGWPVQRAWYLVLWSVLTAAFRLHVPVVHVTVPKIAGFCALDTRGKWCDGGLFSLVPYLLVHPGRISIINGTGASVLYLLMAMFGRRNGECLHKFCWYVCSYYLNGL